jgi:hypothetical protein
MSKPYLQSLNQQPSTLMDADTRVSQLIIVFKYGVRTSRAARPVHQVSPDVPAARNNPASPRSNSDS